MPLTALEKLRLFLRPAGRGIHTHSTGGGYAANLQRMLYGTDQSKEVASKWEDTLQTIRRAEIILLGVPSDVGAGVMRGANFGPIGVREAYLSKYKSYPRNLADIGDVICVPQLLHDEMLNDKQIKMTRKELYPDLSEALPVSPLSITEAALYLVHELNPDAKVVVLGGDHSISWPPMLWCHRKYGKKFGVVHLDAHTDLMDVRLGVKYCYATWAYHALGLMDPQHLVQVGIRVSKRDKAFWTQNFPVQQIWANEVPFQEDAAIQRILDHFLKLGVSDLYISNDIDGTDMSSAPATGTPEAEGLSPEFVLNLISRLGENFNVMGGDIMEVAPPLSGRKDFATEETCVLAALYLQTLLTALMRPSK